MLTILEKFLLMIYLKEYFQGTLKKPLFSTVAVAIAGL
jgi:hypothetical protein